MNIPFYRHELTDADKAAVMAVLNSPYLTQGPTVERFEAALCEYTGARYAVCVSSGTAALYCAYVATGIKRACIPANTFVATKNAATAAGVEVEIVDVDPDDGLLAPDVRNADIVPVDFAGVYCKTLPRHNVKVRDACHSFEFYAQHGRARIYHAPVQRGAAVCFSFHPCKAVACGEGGAVITNDIEVAEVCIELRDNGRASDWVDYEWQPEISNDGKALNLRMSELHAALGLSQLKTVEDRLNKRREIASRYDAAFGDRGYKHPEWSACHLYPLRVEQWGTRCSVTPTDEFVETRKHYYPLHGELAGAREWYKMHVSLPLFPSMTDAEVGHVIETVKRVEGL